MTKLEVARYYEAVAERMVPHLAGRPLTVIRCPGGVAEECFFQKHSTKTLPKRVELVDVREKHGMVTYPVVNDKASLLSMAQFGAVEFHIWGSRVPRLEEPDRLVWDLDPAPDVPWREVRTAARLLRNELEDRGLTSYLMTSGGKGLHVVAPVKPGPGWQETGAATREVVDALATRYPDKYTATMSKAKRVGKVFIDHFRNGRGATAVAPYSLRARKRAPAATPISWDDLGKTAAGDVWTASRVMRRLKTLQDDPWEGAAGSAEQRLRRSV